MLVLKQKIAAGKRLMNFLMSIAVFGLLTAAAAAVSAQSCPLVINGVPTGDQANFSIANPTGTAVSVSIPANTVGFWSATGYRPETGTVDIDPPVRTTVTNNAQVTISPIPYGTKNEVLVTATKIDPFAPASFTLFAIDSVLHNITINVTVDCPAPPTGCTRTQGFWKNKPEQWPVNNLMLGNRTYSQAELLRILRTPTRGNGLVSLSHQLIAAKLNAAAGTTVPASVAQAIAAADAMIGNLVVPPIGGGSLSPASTSATAAILDDYNNGNTPGGPPHCD